MSSLPCKGTATVIVMSRGVPANTLTRVPGVCVCECVSGNLCLGALYNDLLWPWLSFYFTLFQSLPRFFRCCGVARNLSALSCVLRGVSPQNFLGRYSPKPCSLRQVFGPTQSPPVFPCVGLVLGAV
jgi:hypothetical protein